MKPVHRLQIHLIKMHNYRALPTISPNYTWVLAVVWECGEGQTDTQTAVTNIHFALATLCMKCNKLTFIMFMKFKFKHYYLQFQFNQPSFQGYSRLD